MPVAFDETEALFCLIKAGDDVAQNHLAILPIFNTTDKVIVKLQVPLVYGDYTKELELLSECLGLEALRV